MLKTKRKKFGFEIYLEVGRAELLTIRIVVHHQIHVIDLSEWFKSRRKKKDPSSMILQVAHF